MIRAQPPWKEVFSGALAGLGGGLCFGAAMTQFAMLPTIASLVRAGTAQAGFLVHMVIAAIVGAGFGLVMRGQQTGGGEILFWGLAYSTLWWFLGPLTLLPLFLRGAVAWTLPAAQAALPSLIGHLWYGAGTALAFAALMRRHSRSAPAPGGVGILLRGAIAGFSGGWLLGRLLDSQARWLEASGVVNPATHRVAGPDTLAIAVAAGVAFALLYPRPHDGTGPMLIRGTVYGFAWWLAGALTAMALARGMGLAWTLDAVRARFPTMPGFILSGACIAVLYAWLDALARLLFSDDIGARDQEGFGARGLRALGRGAFAGLIGGLVFTIIMVRIGVLPTIARLVGAHSPVAGFIVHLVIANLIGASYGLLFIGRSYDLESALGWGISYGFFWWILGPLTLLPLLLGAAPKWTADVAGLLLPSLVGHLAYGAALGVTFHLLEARYNPWWISYSEAEAERAARRREQVLSSAPALWALVVVIALTLPVVLPCGMPATKEAGYSMSSPAYGAGQPPAVSGPPGASGTQTYGPPAGSPPPRGSGAGGYPPGGAAARARDSCTQQGTSPPSGPYSR